MELGHCAICEKALKANQPVRHMDSETVVHERCLDTLYGKAKESTLKIMGLDNGPSAD